MLRKSLVVAIAATVVSAFGLGVIAPTADAMTAIGNTSTITAAPDPNFQFARVHKRIVNKNGHRNTVWAYNRRNNGVRYHYRHGPYAYYYGGYYYSHPWWTIGGPGLNLCIGC
jgi:hypothetical protein